MTALFSCRTGDGGATAAHEVWQILEVLTALGDLLPGRAPAGRAKLYGAIEALTVDLVRGLEVAGVTAEEPYLQAGRYLEACRRLAASRPPVAGTPRRPARILDGLAGWSPSHREALGQPRC